MRSLAHGLWVEPMAHKRLHEGNLRVSGIFGSFVVRACRERLALGAPLGRAGPSH